VNTNIPDLPSAEITSPAQPPARTNGEPPVFKTDAEQDSRPGLFHFINLTGERGRIWVEEFRSTELMALTRSSEMAVTLLRRRRIEEAAGLFSDIDRRLPAVRESPRAGHQVFERFYYGARAYHFYLLEDYSAADADLERAERAVAAAVAAFRPLLPLTQHIAELRLQRARIARNRNRWGEMAAHAGAVRAMAGDRLPLCAPPDGEPIFFATLAAFYGAIPTLTQQDRESLSGLLDDGRRRESFETNIRWLYALPGTVILYP
jgi:hypothetical protein